MSAGGPIDRLYQFGPGRACGNFMIGLEPAESYLTSAEFLASRGIVPIASVWIPFGRPVMGSMQAPKLDYYQKNKRSFVKLFRKYGL